MMRFENNFAPQECMGPAVALAGLAGGAGGLGTLGTVLSIGSSVLGAIGALKQGQAESQAAKYNERVSLRNAEIAKQQTQAEVDKQDRERRLRVGTSIANAGASGLGIGSFSDVLQSNAMQEELDLMTLKSEGLLRETNYREDAALSNMRSKSAKTAGLFGAGTKLLGGIGSAIG